MRLTEDGHGGIKKCDMCGAEKFYKKPRRWDICLCCERKIGYKEGRRNPPKSVRRLFYYKTCPVCGIEFEIRSRYYSKQVYCSSKCCGVQYKGKIPLNKIWEDKKARTKYYHETYMKIPNKKKALAVRTTIRATILAYLAAERHYNKKSNLEPVVGCSVAQLIEHIESQWQPWMTWDNWGHSTWHLDHIKPLSMFDLADPIQFAEANHYTNIRPLPAHENFVKYNFYRNDTVDNRMTT